VGISFTHPWALLALGLLIPIVYVARRDPLRASRRRRWSLVLRCAIVALLVVGLAGPRLVLPVTATSVAFLLDVSASVPEGERTRASRWVSAAQNENVGALSAVIAVGAEPLVDRPARIGPFVGLRSLPGRDRTDLASALRLGTAVLPADTGRRLVLLSDGRSNSGDLQRQSDLVAAQGVPIDVVPLAAALHAHEVLVAALEVPAASRVGQRFDVVAVVRAQVATEARLQILGEDRTLFDEVVQLEPGENRFAAPVAVDEPGFRWYRALLDPAVDGRTENNEAVAYTVTAGPPRVLIVAADTAAAGPLAEAFAGAGREPVLFSPEAMPSSLLALAEFDAVVLVDVPARALPAGAVRALEPFVRDLGKGLVMAGGEDSFGSGGYRHTPVERVMPVDMEVREKERRPDIALAFVIDKSGSMSACAGCVGGAGPSDSKVAVAREAILQAADLIRSTDHVALVAFDGAAHRLWPLRPFESDSFRDAVAGLTADGGTNIQSGLEMALTMLEDAAQPIKHIILLTDGWSDTSGYDPLLARMDAGRITLSTVAVGSDAATYLAELAGQGGGRHYPVANAADVPQVFVEETLTTLGTFIVEEPFQPVPGAPSDILAGLDANRLPPLFGYNGTTAKQSARVSVWSHLEDPVLAEWHFGLGRAVAWTSDLKRQWATEWVDGPHFDRFALQIVDWVLPVANDDLDVELAVSGGRADVVVTLAGGGAADAPESVSAAITSEEGRATDLELRQTGPRRFEGSTDLPAQGAYLVTVAANRGGGASAVRSAGLVVPYPPEFDDPSSEQTDPRLFALAAATGGRVLEAPNDAFAPVPGVRKRTDIWPWLLAAALVLFPADVAVRRLKLRRADLVALRERVRRERRPPIPTARPAHPVFGRLHAARERAAAKRESATGRGVSAAQSAAAKERRTPAEDGPSRHEAANEEEQTRSVPPSPQSTGGSDEPEGTLERLRRAKQRAKDRQR
jgi:Mg-chelatase subunit ChlD